MAKRERIIYSGLLMLKKVYMQRYGDAVWEADTDEMERYESLIKDVEVIMKEYDGTLNVNHGEVFSKVS